MANKIIINRKTPESDLDFHIINDEVNTELLQIKNTIAEDIVSNSYEILTLTDTTEILKLYEELTKYLHPTDLVTFNNKKDLEVLIKIVCSLFEITDTNLLKTKSRKREIVKSRQVIYYILKMESYGSLNEIGALFNQDHATVLHADEVINNHIDTRDPYVFPKLKTITDIYGLTNKYKLY